MKMEIIESDLKQLFQWIKNHDAAIVQLQEASFLHSSSSSSSAVDAIESLEKRIINIELLLTEEDNK